MPLAHAVGVANNGTVALTIPAQAKFAIRIPGFHGTAETTVAMISIPQVTVTNVRFFDGVTESEGTWKYVQPEGGAPSNLNRAIQFTEGIEYKLDFKLNTATTLTYDNGSATGNPELNVWFEYVG